MIEIEKLQEKARNKAWTWAIKNHATVACECDPRLGKTCTKSGNIRCNARLAAIQKKTKEILVDLKLKEIEELPK